MDADPTRSEEIPAEPAPAPPSPPEPGPYTAAIEAYLAAATWLTALDGPIKVHARTLAASLDQQFRQKGEIQSALASSFDKAMFRLEARRPAPEPAPPRLGDSGPMGERSIFALTLDDT